jgi:hypothetical protein
MRQLNFVRLFLLAALCVLPLSAAPIFFDGVLLGSNEEPPNASPGTGYTEVTIDPETNTMRVQVNFSGLLGLTNIAHIHVINGPGDADIADTIGPVATPVPTFPGFPAGVTTGTYDQTFDMTLASSYNPAFVTNAGGIPEARAALFAGITEGRAYVNVHSSLFPGGEIRDFLTAVPEPDTWALVAGSIVCLGLAAVLRRRP